MYKMLLSHLGFGHAMPNMKKASYEIALKSKKQIAERTYEFIFEKPKDFRFNAGQHVRMTLLNPSETDSKGTSRFLTLANTPSEKNLTVAMRMTDSAFKRVLGKMKNGEKVLIQILQHSPEKSFFIHEDATKPAVFLVGGIGIVPAYSIIKDAIERKLPHTLFLFYSNRRPEDAPYLEEFSSLAKQHQNFTFIATMTDPKKSKKLWKGETGYIDRAMLTRYLNDLKSPIYYISGLTNMVTAMESLLNDIGVNKNNIRSEDFSALKIGLITITNNPSSNKKYLFITAIGLLLIIAIIACIRVFNI